MIVACSLATSTSAYFLSGQSLSLLYQFEPVNIPGVPSLPKFGRINPPFKSEFENLKIFRRFPQPAAFEIPGLQVG